MATITKKIEISSNEKLKKKIDEKRAITPRWVIKFT
jgi:hypothetical protein